MLGAFTAAYMVKQGKSTFPIPLEWLVRYRKIVAAADACTNF